MSDWSIFLAAAGSIIIAIFAYFIWLETQLFWVSIISFGDIRFDGVAFGHHYSVFTDAHLMLILTCFVILCGCVFADFFLKYGYKPRDVALLSGFGMSLASFFIGINFFTNIFYMPYLQFVDGNYFFSGYRQIGMINNNDNINFLIVIVTCSVILVSLGALSTYFYMKLATRARFGTYRKKIIKNFGRILLALMIIPLFIFFVGVDASTVTRYPELGTVSWQLNAERMANDTVVIEYNGYHTPEGVDLGKNLTDDITYIIVVNEKMVFNNSIINRSELNMTINPETGLDFTPGQKVTFSGPEVSQVNNTSLLILLFYDNKFIIYSIGWRI